MSRAEDALAAARAFRTRGEPRHAEPLGSGHIHDTFRVTCEDSGGSHARYVLQRLNTRVFPDPDAVVENAALLTRTLADAGPRRSLRCVETRDDGLAFRDPEGRVWRGFDHVEGSITHDTVASPEQARRAARAFGEFATRLAGLDPERLRITIPGFHDFEARLAVLEAAVAADPAGRARDLAAEVDAARALARDLARELPEDRVQALPVRVVHNDCKLNNVLFDAQSGEALCVIDLDTVMPGSLLVDFGDLVRTASCREPEDSRAPSRVRVDPALYEALTQGYLEGAGPILTDAERELLPLAGPRIALETGIRFLTDHLDGDRYFRVDRKGHNRDRARTQLRLARELLAAQDDARRFVARAGDPPGRR